MQLLCFILVCISCLALGQSVSTPRVEALPASLGIAIDNPSPRFSWTLSSSPSLQSSYRILVSYLPSNGSSAVPWWDSGLVLSNTTTEIIYGGVALVSDSDYSVSVQVVLTNGSSLTSPASRFSMGLLEPSDWSGADWLRGFNQMRLQEPFVFPPASEGGGALTRARAYVTGVGCAELWLNGQRIAADGEGRETYVNPGFSTVFSKRLLYTSYNVADFLLPPPASNVVGLRVGECKYSYLGEFCVGGPSVCNAAILKLSLSFAGGASAAVVTNATGGGGTWVGIQSSILKDHFYNGELVNGSLAVEQQGWSTAAYAPSPSSNGGGWAPAALAPPPSRTLSSHAMPQITGWEVNSAPISVTPVPPPSGNQPGTTSFVFDMGLNQAAVCSIHIPGPTPAGAAITLTYAEQLNADGTVHVGFACPSPCCADGGNCANQSFTYILAGSSSGGEGGETYRPSFAYSGFRWIQVDGWPVGAPPPPVSVISCNATSSGLEIAGGLAFNSTILNGIQLLILRSQRSNLHSIPTDCPQREKRGWAADAHVSAPEAALNLNMQTLYENWLRTFADTIETGCGPLPVNATCPKWHNNQPDGSEEGVGIAVEANPASAAASSDEFPNCYICCYGRPGFGCTANTPNTSETVIGTLADVVPFDKNGYGSMPGSITWMSVHFVVAETLLQHYRDIQALSSNYAALLSHMRYYTSNADPTTGLMTYDEYGDWNSLEHTNPLLLANAYFYYDATIMASIASATGHAQDAQAFLALAALINEALPHAFFNASCGCWDAGSQAAQAVGLYFSLGGAATANATPTILAALVDNIVQGHGGHPTVGTLGTRWLLQALTLESQGAVALAMASLTEAPSWGAMVVGIPGKQPPLGTLWEGWDGPDGYGSSGNHIMLGGGIGEWFYSGALGLSFSYRVAAPWRRAGTDSAGEACLRSAGFHGTNFQSRLALSDEDACAVLSIVQQERDLFASSSSSSSSTSLPPMGRRLDRLREAAQRLEGKSVGATPPLTPSARLLLDASIVHSLKSASGYLNTTAGALEAAWTLSPGGLNDGYSVLRMSLVIPHATTFRAFVPLQRLAAISGASQSPLPLHHISAAPTSAATAMTGSRVVSLTAQEQEALLRGETLGPLPDLEVILSLYTRSRALERMPLPHEPLEYLCIEPMATGSWSIQVGILSLKRLSSVVE